MKPLLIASAVLAIASVGGRAQQAAATPQAAPAQPAVPSEASRKPVFEVVRVNPGTGARTRAVRVEALGRATTVQVGEAVLTREHLRAAIAGTERMKVTSGAKPETREVPVIRLRFTKEGAKALSALSRSAQDGLLAVLVDGKIIADAASDTATHEFGVDHQRKLHRGEREGDRRSPERREVAAEGLSHIIHALRQREGEPRKPAAARVRDA